MNKKGFTIVELLASITIIGLLMVIMIPTIQSASKNIKKKSYENIKEMIINSTIEYISNSTTSGFGIDDIKPEGINPNCIINGVASEDYNYCKQYKVSDILDNNIYYTNEKDVNGKLTIINPINGKSMRNRTFIIYFDEENYTLKGIFSTGENEK